MKAPTQALLLLLALTAGCTQAPEEKTQDPGFDGVGTPYPGFAGGDVKGERNFANLINNYPEGKPARQPWAGAWWPYTDGGIASKGNGDPAAKYDQAKHDGTKTEDWEVINHGPKSPDAAGWVGHCNGWSAAAALYAEPRTDVTVNGVTFFVSDLKALLSEALMEAESDFFGNRVDTGADYNSPKYTDVVPDQFFLVLTNYMGHLKQTVNIDRYTLDQVWNQPLEGYRIEYPTQADYLGPDPSAPNVYRINMTATMWWAEDGVSPGELTPPFDFDTASTAQGEDGIYTFSNRELKFELWLDGPVVFGPDGKVVSSGNVIVTHPDQFYYGGAWKMGEGLMTDAWPDYMWVPYSAQPSSGYMNPEIDIKWIESHLLVPGGHSDPGGAVHPSPEPTPITTFTPPPIDPNPFPSTPQPDPQPDHSVGPDPFPDPFPHPQPSTGPGPEPRPPGPHPGPGPGPEPEPAPHSTLPPS